MTTNAKVGDMGVYVAAPKGEAKAAIIVVPEIFGVNPGIVKKCEKLAAEGYLAVAPEMRRQGVAAALINEGILQHRKLGCPSSKHLAQVWRGVDGERASSGVGF